MEPTEEQIKWFWKQCGCYKEDDLWYTPDGFITDTFPFGELPYLDLNNLFQHAVPKLRIKDKYPYLTEIILGPTTCDDEIYYCYLRYDSLHDDGCVEREEMQSSDTDPALALFWVIFKALGGEDGI